MARDLTLEEVRALAPGDDEVRSRHLMLVEYGDGVAFTLHYDHYTTHVSQCRRWWAEVLGSADARTLSAEPVRVNCTSSRRGAPSKQGAFRIWDAGEIRPPMDIVNLLDRHARLWEQAITRQENETYFDEVASWHEGYTAEELSYSEDRDRD